MNHGEISERGEELIRAIFGLPGKLMITIALSEDLIKAFDISEEGEIGYKPEHSNLFFGMLAEAFLNGGSIVIRQFLKKTAGVIERDDRKIPIPLKRIYGVKVAEGNWRPLSAIEIKDACSRDYKTGEYIGPEEAVEYCDFPARTHDADD